MDIKCKCGKKAKYKIILVANILLLEDNDENKIFDVVESIDIKDFFINICEECYGNFETKSIKIKGVK